MSSSAHSAVISVLSKKGVDIVKELQKLLPNNRFHHVSLGNIADDEQFKESQVIIGEYNLVGPHLYNLPNLKWVQGTMAGVDSLIKYIHPENPPTFPITRFTGRHFGTLMSEYVLAQIINNERSFYEVNENQRTGKGWVRKDKIYNHRSVAELTIGILGMGNIGDKIAKTLSFMGAKILAFGRSETLNSKENKHISEYYNRKTLPQLLQKCDYFVNVLPHTEETRGLLNGDILESCKVRGAVLINIGRGSIISEQCLIDALNKKWLSGAILDVFEDEPLSNESPLWKTPNVVITPHVSGVTRAKDVAELVYENFKYFESNSPIPATVDFSKGY